MKTMVKNMMKNKLGNIATAIATAPVWLSTYAMAQVADVRGALEINQNGLTEIANSQLNEDGIEGGIVAVGNITLILAGCIGVIMTAFGVAKLWGHYKEGEQARGSVMPYWFMAGIGGLMTVIAIVTAFVPAVLLDGV
jgi:hypothetical protein